VLDLFAPLSSEVRIEWAAEAKSLARLVPHDHPKSHARNKSAFALLQFLFGDAFIGNHPGRGISSWQ